MSTLMYNNPSDDLLEGMRKRNSRLGRLVSPLLSTPMPPSITTTPVPLSSVVINTEPQNQSYIQDYQRNRQQQIQQQQQQSSPLHLQQEQQQQQLQQPLHARTQRVQRIPIQHSITDLWGITPDEIQNHHVCAFPLTRSRDYEVFYQDPDTKEITCDEDDYNRAESRPLGDHSESIAINPPDSYKQQITVFKTSLLYPDTDKERWIQLLNSEYLTIPLKRNWIQTLKPPPNVPSQKWYCANPIRIRRADKHRIQNLYFELNTTPSNIKELIKEDPKSSQCYIPLKCSAESIYQSFKRIESLESSFGNLSSSFIQQQTVPPHMNNGPHSIFLNSITIDTEYNTLPFTFDCQLHSRSLLDINNEVQWILPSGPNPLGIAPNLELHHVTIENQHLLQRQQKPLLFVANDVTQKDYFNEFINWNEKYLRSRLKACSEGHARPGYYQIPLMAENDIHPTETLIYLVIFSWHNMKQIAAQWFKCKNSTDIESMMSIQDRYFLIRMDLLDIIVRRLFEGPMLKDNHLMRIDCDVEWRLYFMNKKWKQSFGNGTRKEYECHKEVDQYIEHVKDKDQSLKYFIKLTVIYEDYLGQQIDGNPIRQVDLYSQPLITISGSSPSSLSL